MAARQKWLQTTERALSIARTQKDKIACKDGRERMVWSPPAVFVEEAIQLPPEDILFTVPDNWHSPTSFPEDETRAVSMVHHNAGTMDSHKGDFPICYIEDELLEEFLQMALHDIISEGLSPFTVLEHEPGSTGMGEEGGVEERSVKMGHQDGAKEGTWAAASEVEGGRTSKEGGEVLAPPPILKNLDQWHVPPPFFHP
jgi:hypothetical protein